MQKKFLRLGADWNSLVHLHLFFLGTRRLFGEDRGNRVSIFAVVLESRMVLVFSEPVGVMDSNEVELREIRKVIHLWTRFGSLLMQSHGLEVGKTPRKLVNIVRDMKRP